MTAAIVVGLFFPGMPMLILGVLVAKLEARARFVRCEYLRWRIQQDEATNRKLVKIWKRQRKARSRLALPPPDRQYQLNIWT